MKLLRIALLVLPLVGGLSFAQQPPPAEPKPGDIMIDRYLRAETARLDTRFLDGARTKEEWEARRGKLKEQFLEMLGLWPLPERTPLNAKVTGALERDTFRVEKLHFQSKPGLYVTANLFLPKKVEGKLPGILYVCGHSNKGRDGNKTGYQHHAAWFASNGYVCLIVDTLQLGEIAGIHHGTHREGRWWWQAAGYTPAGVECWNGIRAIDYLASRPEVDPDKIAVTGRSGGGATTLWVSAADERVKVSVPVSGMSDWETHVADKVINGHCDCMFPINTYRWEFTTIAALIAPRPLLVLNSGHDNIFPMPGNERQRGRLETLYKLYVPKPETLFDIGVTPGGHKDTQELRLMAYRWINTHLKKDTTEPREPPYTPIEGKELRVFPEDKDIPAGALNAKIDETFVLRAAVQAPKNAGEFEKRRSELLDALRSKSFREWPEQVGGAEVIKRAKDGGILLGTEPGIAVMAFEAAAVPKPERLCLIVLNPDEPEEKLPEWAKGMVNKSDAVLLLSPRGCGGLAWTRKSPPNTVERSHALLGRTVDAGRVWDVQAAARWLHENVENNSPILVAGRGQAGVLGAYAALFEPSIGEVVLVEPPASHKDGPIFLNVLRVLDTPDALGLLAPRTLTLVNARDKGFERTAQWYQAAGAEKKLKRQ